MGKSAVQKKKYIHKIEMRNETEFPDIFETYKDDIHDHIMSVMNSFLFDIDLLVIFRTLDDEKNFVNSETYNGGTTIQENKYTVIFNIDSLKLIPRDNGLDIAIAIQHELAHVYDLYHTMHNKYYKINPLKVNHRTLNDFIISKGWGFWTEFYAYFMTYKMYKYQHGYPTFLQLVKGYEKLQKQHKEINMITDYNSEDAQCTLKGFINNIENLSYAVVKYIAGYIEGTPYLYEYCEKTRNRKSFEIMEDLTYGLMKKILPLLTNTYGRGMAKKMCKLGDYLIKNLYIKFDLYPIKHHKYIRFAFYS